MSIANLLQPNSYDIYSGALETNSLVLENADNVHSVKLSCNTNDVLVVGDTGTNNILAGGIQFSPSQNVLNNYVNNTSTDTVFALSNGVETGQFICQFSRIGGMVFVQIRGFIEESVNSLVSTVAVPYIPSTHSAYFTIPVNNNAATKKAGNKLCWIDTNGHFNVGVSLNDSGGLDNAATYYIGSGPDAGTDRYYFYYIL